MNWRKYMGEEEGANPWSDEIEYVRGPDAVAVAGGHWSFEAEVKSGEGDGDDRGPSPSLEERSWILSTGGRGSGVSLLSPAEELGGGRGPWILVDDAGVRSPLSSHGFPPRPLGSWLSSPRKGRGSGRVSPRVTRSKWRDESPWANLARGSPTPGNSGDPPGIPWNQMRP